MNERSRPKSFNASFLLVGTQIVLSVAIVLATRLAFGNAVGLRIIPFLL
jgi:hypothetical protein